MSAVLAIRPVPTVDPLLSEIDAQIQELATICRTYGSSNHLQRKQKLANVLQALRTTRERVETRLGEGGRG